MAKKTKGKSDDIDIKVGEIIKSIRLSKGISQEKMATALGVTFQQIQKRDKGVNRWSAGSLFKVSKFLDVPIGELFPSDVENNFTLDIFEKHKKHDKCIQEIRKVINKYAE